MHQLAVDFLDFCHIRVDGDAKNLAGFGSGHKHSPLEE